MTIVACVLGKNCVLVQTNVMEDYIYSACSQIVALNGSWVVLHYLEND